MDLELSDVFNSPILWVLCGLMVAMSVIQSIIYMRNALKEADRIGIDKSRRTASIRSACLTALGPSLSPIVSVLALMAVVGGPTTWMRLCDVGAARTELGVVSLMATLAGAEVGGESFGITAWNYSLWGMALNNFGWLFIVFILVHRMNKVVNWMDTKYDPKWIKTLMAASTMAMFGYLLSNQLYTFEASKWTAAVIGAGSMLLISILFKKHQRLQELALGISLIIGMLATQAIFGSAA